MVCDICWKEYRWHFNSRYCCDKCKEVWKSLTRRKYNQSDKWKEAMRRRHKNPKRVISEERYRSTEKHKQHNNNRVKKYYMKVKDDEWFKQRRKEKYAKYIEENLENIRWIRRIASKKYKSTVNWKMVCNLNRQKRRALEKDEDACTKKEWLVILEQHNYLCAYCWCKDKIEIDHIIPISKWWRHIKENLQPLCRSCNGKKNNKIEV